MYAKKSVFKAASFGGLMLNEKQKKPFVSLNNEVTKASPVCLVVQTETSFIIHIITSASLTTAL